MLDIVQKFGVDRYIHQPNTIKRLPKFLEELQSKRVLVLHGSQSWQAIKKYWPEETVPTSYLLFSGECSFEEAKRIETAIKKQKVDTIIGVGGGKVLDTVKAAVAELYQVKSILIPTLPSNCACLTPLSIMYSEEGLHLHTIRFNRSTNLVLIEPQLLAEAPLYHFSSGVGDTLAKWYENRVSFEQLPDEQKTVPVEFGQKIAKDSADTVLTYGAEALLDVKEKKATHAFSKVLDGIYLLAGLVGGMAGKYGRSVVAHAFYYAHTDILIEAKRENHYSHGATVAYGVLVQLSLQNKWNELKELIQRYPELNLPILLEEIGLIKENEEELLRLGKKVLKEGSYAYKINEQLQPKDIVEAMLSVEEMAIKDGETHDYQII